MSDSASSWTTAHQSPLSVGFPRQEYWSELPSPSPGDLLNTGIKPASLTSPALAGEVFTTSTTWEAPICRKLTANNSYIWEQPPFCDRTGCDAEASGADALLKQGDPTLATPSHQSGPGTTHICACLHGMC